MRDWLPVPGTTKERLIRSALTLFSETPYESVSVNDLAERAGVTTGSLYHHFGGKPELYELVRADVERRVADRVDAILGEGDVRQDALAPALLAGFDWVVRSGFARLIGALPADPAAGELHRTVVDAVGESTAIIALAGWRAALSAAAASPARTEDLRAALAGMLG